MLARGGKLPSYFLLSLALALPLVLVAHSIFAMRELDEMRAIFLRDRAANVAARLEAMSPRQVAGADFDDFIGSEEALIAIQVFGPADLDFGNPAVQAIRSGTALYKTEDVRVAGRPVFRAYVPFHSGSSVYVARIDLSRDAPDFILVHARHNLHMAILSGSVLLIVALYAIWESRRAARLERQRLEMKRLAELGTLSAVLAHEIRNPLGAIKGFAQLAREHAEPRRAKPLDAIVREAKRLENLVNSLLLYGRPLNPSIRDAEWDPLATELAVHANEAIGARKIRFSSTSDLKQLRTDPDLLKQALLNLIRNAVDAVGELPDAEVRLQAGRAKDNSVLISVEDNGLGIPEGVRPRLFSPFFTTKASGTGLGLSITKKVVECLGGSLRLLPADPRGTRAEVTLYGTNSRY